MDAFDNEPEVVEELVANIEDGEDRETFCFLCEYSDTWNGQRMQEEITHKPHTSLRHKISEAYNMYQNFRDSISHENFGFSPDWDTATIRRHLLRHDPDPIHKVQNVLDETYVMFMRIMSKSVRKNSKMPDPDTADRALKYAKETVNMAKRLQEMQAVRDGGAMLRPLK